MGVTDKNYEYVRRAKAIISECRQSGNNADWKFGQKVQNDMKNPAKQIIWPTPLYCRAVVILYNNPLVKISDAVKILEYGQHVYSLIFPQGVETQNFEQLAEAFLDMFAANGAIAKTCFNIAIFNLFNDKRNYVKWMQVVMSDVRYLGIAERSLDYGVEARGYFPNEEAFTANYIYVCMKMIKASDPEEVFKTQVRNVEHMAGIYEVDEAMIMEAEQQIAVAKNTVERARDILEVLENRTKSVDRITEHSVERIQQVCETEVEVAKARLSDIDVKLNEAYDKFMDTQRSGILLEKQQLVDSIVTESETALAEFRQNVKSVINMAKLELAKLNQESGQVITKIETYMSDDARMKEMLKTGEEQTELLKKLERLVILNDSNIDMLESRIAAEAESKTEAKAAAKKGTGKDAKQEPAVSVAVVRPQEDEDPDVIPDANPLLDESIDFQDRYKLIQKAKKEMEKRGEHFHKMFDDVLIAVLENANPYLIGPSGCGKTYMVGQIAKLLNTSFIDIGYINEEYDILGFQTANGGYSRPNFYRCYKYGKIAFCDELDNGNSRATVKLNSFLSNTKNAGYSFPHGEHVKRHPNFRIIAAGNTSGNGADSAYSTREKIEESVQQRFTPIYIGYDNEVERAILDSYTDWYEFIVLFRDATNAWSVKSHSVASGIITTRDAARIRKYLDNGSFSMEKILDYEFIQTKDESYLAFLAEYIKGKVKKQSQGEEIAKCFISKVDAIRQNDTRQ